jgi:hypothetical protein
MSIDLPQFAPPRMLESPKADSSRVLYGRSGEGGAGLDGELIVEFYIKPYPMEYLTESMGFPIFQDRIWVRIVAPGNSKTVWDTLASGIEYDTAIDPESGEYHTTWEVLQQCANGDRPDTAKYPNAWARFMRRGEKADDGWPIEEWGVVTRSYAESLKLLSIPTVEALAALSDANAGAIMGGRKYRDLARAAVDERARNRIVASEQAKASRAEEKVNLQDEKIKQLEATIVNMQAQFAQGMRQQVPMMQSAAPPAPQPLKTASVKTSKRTRDIVESAEAKEDA